MGYRKINISPGQMLKAKIQYLEEGMSLNQIAKELGMCRQTLATVFRKAGIPIRPSVTALAKVQPAFESLKSDEAVVEEFKQEEQKAARFKVIG